MVMESAHGAREEVVAWFAAEKAETADVDLPNGPDDFELSVARWLRYVPRQYWPFVAAWVAVIARYARKPVSAASLKQLRGMMRRDVQESVAELWGASPATVAAWCAWYPAWVEAIVSEHAAKDPWFDMLAEDHHRLKLLEKVRDDSARKQEQRDHALATDLHAHLGRHGGIVRWRPGLIARKMRHGRGRRPDARRVAEMAAALVRLDVAAWKRRPNSGKPWALVLTGTLAENALSH